MKRTTLGRTDISVSEICLGTMTFGSQNTQDEGFAQMDYAVDRGVNFLDTAEVYPVAPMGPDTYGDTEVIVGNWLKSRGQRDKVVVATKIAGRGMAWVNGGTRLSAARIPEAVEDSLKRLKTDYIDLYQIHWPNRPHYHFRQMWDFHPETEPVDMRQEFADILGGMGRQVEAGKIRTFGLSNETAWGTMQFLNLAEELGLPRVATIQNEYSLMYRNYDLDLAELSHHEDVGLIAYSPLAAGILTDKYANGALPAGSRATLNTGLGSRLTEHSSAVASEYAQLAQAHGLDPVQMAIAFCMTRPFMTAPIVGATSLEQLTTVLGSTDVTLNDDVMAGIAALHKKHPQPY